MKLGSLFAGIGGFELAATWAGIEPVWSNEIDKYACNVLRKNFKHEIIEKDIREIGSQNLQPVDIISGGFPCQPFSSAGKRKGKEDDRYLWPEMLRIIRELKPSYVIGENVAGLLSMENGKTLERILSDLENEGYRNEVFIIPAASVGAWHRRDRVWICANSIDSTNRANRGPLRKEEEIPKERGETGRSRMPSGTDNEIQQNATKPNGSRHLHGKSKEQPTKGGVDALSKSKSGSNNDKYVSDTDDKRQQHGIHSGISGREGAQPNDKPTKGCGKLHGKIESWEAEPNVGRVVNGIPNRVDRLKGLGNAIVPQIAYELFKAINNGT